MTKRSSWSALASELTGLDADVFKRPAKYKAKWQKGSRELGDPKDPGHEDDDLGEDGGSTGADNKKENRVDVRPEAAQLFDADRQGRRPAQEHLAMSRLERLRAFTEEILTRDDKDQLGHGSNPRGGRNPTKRAVDPSYGAGTRDPTATRRTNVGSVNRAQKTAGGHEANETARNLGFNNAHELVAHLQAASHAEAHALIERMKAKS